MRLYCGCVGTEATAGYQDLLYGKGVRVYVRLGKDGRTCACTICGKKRDTPATDAHGVSIGPKD